MWVLKRWTLGLSCLSTLLKPRPCPIPGTSKQHLRIHSAIASVGSQYKRRKGKRGVPDGLLVLLSGTPHAALSPASPRALAPQRCNTSFPRVPSYRLPLPPPLTHSRLRS
jgi:hypothetical protein